MEKNIIDINIINDKASSYFLDDSVNIMELDDSIILVNNVNYAYKKKLSSGAYGVVYLFTDTNTFEDRVVKIGLDKDSGKAVNAEIKIHSILSAFQNTYLKDFVFKKRKNFYPKVAPNIINIFHNQNTDMKAIMMEKYDGDIYETFVNLDPDNNDDIKLLVEFLFQISCQLRLLQKYFDFMHNDLKATNIFYKLIDKSKGIKFDNIRFVMGDFGGSTITFNKFVTKGDVRGSEVDFNPNKDLFMVVHLIITFINPLNRSKLISFFSRFFKEIDTNISINDNDIWHNIYTYNNYPDEYNPKIFLQRLGELYPEYRPSREQQTNTINLSKKYKIYY